MEYKMERTLQRAQAKMLREFYSGVPVESLCRRYGYSEKRIRTLAGKYIRGEIDIFAPTEKKKIGMLVQ